MVKTLHGLKDIYCVVTGLTDEGGGVNHDISILSGEVLREGEESKFNNSIMRIQESELGKVRESDFSVKNTSNLIEVASCCLTEAEVKLCQEKNKRYIQDQLDRMRATCMNDLNSHISDYRKPIDSINKNSCELCGI